MYQEADNFNFLKRGMVSGVKPAELGRVGRFEDNASDEGATGCGFLQSVFTI